MTTVSVVVSGKKGLALMKVEKKKRWEGQVVVMVTQWPAAFLYSLFLCCVTDIIACYIQWCQWAVEEDVLPISYMEK